MKFRFKHADKIVGLFILVAVVFLCAVLVVIGFNRRWFRKDFEYQTRFRSATGLSRSMPINLSGFEIGYLKQFELNSENQVDCIIVIFNEYHVKVRPNSVIELKSSPLGSKLFLYPGKNTRAPMLSGEFIPSTHYEKGMKLVEEKLVDKPKTTDPISDLLAGLGTILDNVETITAQINGDAEGDLNQAISNLSDITYQVNDESIPQLNASLDNIKTMTDNLSILSEGLKDPKGLIPTLISSPGSTVDTLFNDNNALYDEIYSIVSGLDESIANLITLTASLTGMTPQVNLLLDQVNVSLKEAQKVMEGLKNNPLLKGGISEEIIPEKSKTEYRDEEF